MAGLAGGRSAQSLRAGVGEVFDPPRPGRGRPWRPGDVPAGLNSFLAECNEFAAQSNEFTAGQGEFNPEMNSLPACVRPL
jgi:hypothetical protein